MTGLYTSPYEGGRRKGKKIAPAVPENCGGEAPSRVPAKAWALGALRAGAVLAVFVLGSVPFWIWPLDLVISSRFYTPEQGWFHHLMPVWEFLYEFGTLPSVLVVLVALVVFAAGWPVVRWRRYRKMAGYLILCMALGPGLLINVCLKSEWGRPRPRHVEQFGGRHAFERVLTMDPRSPGESFPCGHCSMGFYLFAVAMLAGWRSRAGCVAALGAAGFGTLIGMARIVQGGHFASDVWWSAGVCLAVAVFLFYGFALDKSLWYEPREALERRKLPVWLGAGAGVGMAVMIGAALLATPYRREEDHPLELGRDRAFRLILNLEGDRHEIFTGEEFRIQVRGSGHGMPKSAMKSELLERRDYETWHGSKVDLFLFRQRLSGWFRELDQETRVTVPRRQPGRLEVEVRSGDVFLHGAAPEARQVWELVFPGRNGRVVVDPSLRKGTGPGGGLDLRVSGGELAGESPAGAPAR